MSPAQPEVEVEELTSSEEEAAKEAMDAAIENVMEVNREHRIPQMTHYRVLCIIADAQVRLHAITTAGAVDQGNGMFTVNGQDCMYYAGGFYNMAGSLIA